ncbi:hypothetical protein HJC10_24965 [Corallococcus exiguus]|uniref:hypothetical protein n=1 Tax=Corallococcus TaxID=83461 RepID=UPI000EDC0407|nr:hypothetical protein [Corallococcus sp. AB032C]NNB89495.1 hypothetical protein [Corallococcus exiguus]NNB96080.1 hypothetical protein [Corallococcus exiguus]NNC06096.1 hypothetical protein [Corallococcus exiguus]NPC50181.1 hypothetical protein [Corallococcus exiguus]RKH79858.1 hypothetical protein D7X99_23820 [Corallococcus sp. AB032C]
MFKPTDIQRGMTVRDRDGEALGGIVAVDPRGFTIGTGRIFEREYPVRFSDVADLDGDDVYLRRDLASLPGAMLAEGALELEDDHCHPDRAHRPVAYTHDLTGALVPLE